MKKSSVTCAILLFSCINCFSQAGHLDVSFGAAGKTYTNILNLNGGNESIQAIAIQPDGKILLAGTTTSPSIILRLNTNGTLDNTFDGDGILNCFGMSINAIAVQADGKIVAGGYSGFGGSVDFTLARFNANGSIDVTFDLDGRVTTQVSEADDRITALAIQADGKILAAGVSYNGTDDDFALVRYNIDGSPDLNFDADGIVTTPMGSGSGGTGYDQANAIAVQSDGKIILAGYSFMDFAIARYNSNGSLDNTFDSDGKVLIDFGSSDDQAMSVAVQPNGKIVVAGFTWDINTGFDFALARIKVDGSPDNGFDGDGKVTTDFNSIDRATCVALQSDGKIVAAGYNENFAVARYNSDGSPDNSFDGDGQLTTDIGSSSTDWVNAMAMQSDGKIVVAGRYQAGNRYDMAVMRYDTNGTPDNSFDSDGKLTVAVPCSEDHGTCIAIQADGKVLIGGVTSSNLNGSGRDFAIARYNTNGTPDNSFDADGRLTTAFGSSEDVINAIAVQADGKIVVAGAARRSSGVNYDFAVGRYNADGTPDNSFDGDGKVFTTISAFDNIATSIAIQPDGKIIVAGYSGAGSDVDFTIVRYNTNGTPDNSFDSDGIVTTAIGPSDDRIHAIALQPDGKILVAGSAMSASDLDFAIARYNSNGSPDNSFDGDGKMLIDFGSSNDIAYGMALQNDGKIVLAGYTQTPSITAIAVARVSSTGIPDTGFDADGQQVTQTSIAGIGYAVAVQSDGKIVVAGDSDNGMNMDFVVVRYKADGAPDNSFDLDGIAEINLETNSNEHLAGMKLSGDRIYVVGETTTAGGYDFALAAVLSGPTGAALPLTLLNFSGALNNADALLDWNTENEAGAQSFILERSFDGALYTQLGALSARNSGNREKYQYTDAGAGMLHQPVIYYRLKQVDIDGKFRYSRIVALYPNRSVASVRFYPNPVTDEAGLVITLQKQSIIMCRVMDMSGKTVHSQQLNLPGISTSMSLDLRHLSAGVYYLLLQGEDLNYTKQFIKQ